MRRIWLASMLALLCTCTGLGVAASSATAAGTAVGSFEIDGNTPDAPAGEPTDWDAPASAQNPPLTVTPFADGTGSQDDGFSMGSKQEEPGNWSCIPSSSPQKGDITPGGNIAFRTIGGKQFVYVNFKRKGTTGSADIDYEFSKSAEPNPACPALPKRTPGDVLIAFDATNGGKNILVRAFEWSGTATLGTFIPLTTGQQGVEWDGATNADGTDSNKNGDFGEAVLNLTDTIGDLSCGEFNSVYMKSRSSTEINSALQDRTAKKPVATGLCPVSSITKSQRNFTTNPTGLFSQQPIDAKPGDAIEYSLTYSNAGPGIAHDVVISDTISSQATFLSCPSCNSSNLPKITWNLGDVAAAGSVTVTFRVTLTGNFPLGTSTAVTNVATVATREDSTTSNQTTVNVKTPATTGNKDVRNVTTSGSFGNAAAASPGDVIEYRVVVTNAGPGQATGVVVTDDVATGSTYVASSCTGGTSCSFASPTVTWQVGTINAGASATLTFSVSLAA
jgi:uncharacterized repeat protein (TIGR01451 family)